MQEEFYFNKLQKIRFILKGWWKSYSLKTEKTKGRCITIIIVVKKNQLRNGVKNTNFIYVSGRAFIFISGRAFIFISGRVFIFISGKAFIFIFW